MNTPKPLHISQPSMSTSAPIHMAVDAPLPRLLMVSSFLPPGYGSRVVQQDILDRLRPRGYSIVTASPYISGFARGVHMVFATIAYRQSYDVALVDVYSGRAFWWAFTVAGALRAIGRPFVLVLHGGNLPRYAKRHPDLVRRCLDRARAVVAPSRFLQEQMRPYRADIGLIPNGIEISRYPYRPRTAPRANLMWLRALYATYNPEMVLRVVESLAHGYPETRLTLVGPDKGDGTLSRVRHTAAALGVTERVLLAGAVKKEDVPSWLDRGDIFINTTNTDNTPVSVIEAMACGLPVVSTDVGGLPYLLEDKHDALLVPKNDDRAMTKAILRLIEEPGLAARLTANARAKVESFDWDVVIPQWTDILSRVRLTP